MSGAQFTLLFLVSYLTAGIFTFPQEMVRAAGGGAIWSLLLTSALALGVALLIMWMGSHFPGKTAVQWGDILITVPANRVLACLGAAVHIVAMPLIVRSFAEVLKETYFQQTPVWALVAALMVVSAYGAYSGIEAIGRATAVVLPTLLVVISGVYLLAYPLTAAYRLHPPGAPLSSILRACLPAGMLYEGIAAIMMLQSKLPRPARAMRYVAYSMAISTLIFTAIYYSTLAVFGRGGINSLVFPAAELLVTVRLRGWFLERLGVFAEVVWTGLVVLNAAVHQWAVSLAGTQIFGVNHRKGYPWMLAALLVTQVGIALAPRNIDVLYAWLRLIPWGGLYLNLGLPVVWAVVGMARGKLPRTVT